MAGKGTFVAYQPLRPTELKVGDIFAKMNDDLIKMGQAQEAARLKRLADEKKSFDEMLKMVKPEIWETIPTMQNETNKLYDEVVNLKNMAGIYAENGDMANARRYARLASNASNDYLKLKTIVGSKDFLDTYKKNNELIASGKYFKGDPNFGLHATLSTKQQRYRINQETGNIEVGYIDNTSKDTDGEIKWGGNIDTLVGQYRGGIQEDLVYGNQGMLATIKNFVPTLKVTTDNGFRKRTIKQYDDARGMQAIKSYFGYNPNKDITEQWDGTAPAALNQYYYHMTGGKKYIESAEDLKAAIDLVDVYARGTVDREDTEDVVNIPAVNIYGGGGGYRRRGRYGNGVDDDDNAYGDGRISVGNVVLNSDATYKGKTVKNHFDVLGVNYFVAGNTDDGKASRVGVTAFWDVTANKGKGDYRFAVNIASNDGKQVVIEKTTATRASQILASNKVKDPSSVLDEMKNIARQENIRGYGYNTIGNNWSNYRVNTRPTYGNSNDGKGNGGNGNNNGQSPIPPSQRATPPSERKKSGNWFTNLF